MARTDPLTVRGPKIEEPDRRREIKPSPGRKKEEEKLDEGLKETFPASDPPASTRETSRDAEQHPKATGHRTH